MASPASASLPNNPRLNALVAGTLMAVHTTLATGSKPPGPVIEQVKTGLNQFRQTLSADSLAHPIVAAMESLYLKMVLIQGNTSEERRAFLDPELQVFILTLGVIPCVGEYLAGVNNP